VKPHGTWQQPHTEDSQLLRIVYPSTLLHMLSMCAECMCCHHHRLPVQGELWRAPDRIGYEWSMAGYQQGNPLPLPAVTHNLKTNFGARGDGVTDDTQALVNALNTMTRGVLLIPAGGAGGVGVGAVEGRSGGCQLLWVTMLSPGQVTPKGTCYPFILHPPVDACNCLPINSWFLIPPPLPSAPL
jgi:hypothetical protein